LTQVVLDTNVVVSALLAAGGNPAKILNLVVNGSFHHQRWLYHGTNTSGFAVCRPF
jgi:hypothetical protein